MDAGSGKMRASGVLGSLEVAKDLRLGKGRLMQVPWTSRFYHLLKGPNPLHPKVWNGRLSALSFRRFAHGDTRECLNLYALNEPDRFPAGVRERYEKWLNEQESYVLVAEKEGRLVASGGVNYCLRKDIAVLCFGLVHPGFQGAGIGTALLLARLALLNPAERAIRVIIFAVEKSVGFYRRFGFQRCMPWLDDEGKVQPSGLLVLRPWQIRGCRKLLADHGVLVPQDEEAVPLDKNPEGAGIAQASMKLCVSCGMAIRSEMKMCPNCGWTQPDVS